MPLGKALTFSRASVAVEGAASYPNIGMLSYGRGPFEKPPIDGQSTSAQTLFRIRADQFIYSRLFAFEGAYGVVPKKFDGYFVSNEFPVFDIDTSIALPRYIEWMFRLPSTWKAIAEGSTGLGHRRQRVHPDQLLQYEVTLPSVGEQSTIVDRLDRVEAWVEKAQSLRDDQRQHAKSLLMSAFKKTSADAPLAPMAEIAPLVRRPVDLSFDVSYPELGIRSFFKGTFHKPKISALELGKKRIFWIHPGDLVFSNVFAWEGAIALARDEDAEHVGSHRYITCVPKPDVAEARYLLQYFQSPEGIAKIQEASPGGAGRNRTLGLDALDKIRVPLADIEKQRAFAEIHHRMEEVEVRQERLEPLYASVVPSLLERVFAC